MAFYLPVSWLTSILSFYQNNQDKDNAGDSQDGSLPHGDEQHQLIFGKVAFHLPIPRLTFPFCHREVGRDLGMTLVWTTTYLGKCQIKIEEQNLCPYLNLSRTTVRNG